MIHLNIVIEYKTNLEPNDGEKVSRKFKSSRDLMSFNRIPVIKLVVLMSIKLMRQKNIDN